MTTEVAEPVTAVLVTQAARTYVSARGGVLYIRVRRSRCCSGELTFLDASTKAKSRAEADVTWQQGNLEIKVLSLGLSLPETIEVDLRGSLHPHLVAYWNGCAYKL